MDTFASVFELGRKSCGMSESYLTTKDLGRKSNFRL